MLDGFWRDFAFALRSLMRRPGYFIAAVTTLALGIGANTAIFGVVNAVLLAPPALRRSAACTAAARCSRRLA